MTRPDDEFVDSTVSPITPSSEVPITVRSATTSDTQRLRIPGRSSTSTRFVFAGKPEQVEVNDGGVPETKTSLHTRQLVLPGH